MAYVIRRLGQAILLLFAVSALTFLFSALAPGKYVDEMRLNPQISPGTLAALRARYELDRPFLLRYGRWMLSVGHGELGYSFANNSPVGPLLWTRARNTLLLTGTATLVMWSLALPIGIYTAEKRGRPQDRLLSWLTSVLLVVPEFTVALGLLALAVRSGWLPVGGMISIGFETLSWMGKAKDLSLHLLLPVTVLVASSFPVLVRHVRAAIAEALKAPFMRAAQSHGLPKSRLLYKYALRASAHPLIALFGISVGTLLSASLFVEIVMSWPGLGPLLLEAILARDLYVVIGAVLFSTFFLVTGNLISDLLLQWADPRIRSEHAS
jgi:peptide/nickel transport system permease protein